MQILTMPITDSIPTLVDIGKKPRKSSQNVHKKGIDKCFKVWYNIGTKRKKVHKMNETILDLAIRRFGFENPRTIVIAYLLESGQTALAEDLWNTLTEEE